MVRCTALGAGARVAPCDGRTSGGRRKGRERRPAPPRGRGIHPGNPPGYPSGIPPSSENVPRGIPCHPGESRMPPLFGESHFRPPWRGAMLCPHRVMAGLVPAIHVFAKSTACPAEKDARNESGHDGGDLSDGIASRAIRRSGGVRALVVWCGVVRRQPARPSSSRRRALAGRGGRDRPTALEAEPLRCAACVPCRSVDRPRACHSAASGTAASANQPSSGSSSPSGRMIALRRFMSSKYGPRSNMGSGPRAALIRSRSMPVSLSMTS